MKVGSYAMSVLIKESPLKGLSIENQRKESGITVPKIEAKNPGEWNKMEFSLGLKGVLKGDRCSLFFRKFGNEDIYPPVLVPMGLEVRKVELPEPVPLLGHGLAGGLLFKLSYGRLERGFPWIEFASEAIPFPG
jgi:hypothetical protein